MTSELPDLADHYAAFDNTGGGDFVCACGLPWTAGEGCPFVRGFTVAREMARREVKAAVEEWFTDVSLDDLFAVKGWNPSADHDPEQGRGAEKE